MPLASCAPSRPTATPMAAWASWSPTSGRPPASPRRSSTPSRSWRRSRSWRARPPPSRPAALDWLQTITNADGGIPFVLPTAKGWPHAPWWAPTDDPPSSLLMTAGVTAAAYRLKLDGHPWLAPATDFVWNALTDLKLSDAYSFRYAVRFLDAVPDRARADGRARRAARAHAERRHPQGRGGRGGRGAQRDRGRAAPRPRRPRALPRRAHRSPARRAGGRPEATTAAGTSPGPPGTRPSPSSGAGW